MTGPDYYNLDYRLTRKAWVKANPGVITNIAKALDVTSQYVSMVLSGKRRHEAIEDMLRDAGAPMKEEN